MAGVNRKFLCLRLMAGVLLFFATRASFGQGTAFNYQGQLVTNGVAANGYYNFKFTLYTAATNGLQASYPLTNDDVAVSNGLFTTTLDFGPGTFTGYDLWLAIGVCPTNLGTTFTLLSPLQPVLPVPYAIFANTASNLLGTLYATQLSGTLPASAFAGYTNTVALTNSANLFGGTFSGNGGGVTNVIVTNLTGVLADSQLPNNTAYLNSNQTFTANNSFSGVNTFTNLGNSFSGSFFGNGLVGWVAVAGTSVQAQIDHGYVLTNSQVVTVTLPISTNVGDIVRVAGAGATGWQVAQNSGQSVLGNFMTYGKTWTQNQQQGNWTGMAASSSGTEMIAADYGTGLYVSDNSGASWSENTASQAPGAQSVAVAISSSGTTFAVAVTNGGYLYISTNSGSSWASPNYGGSGYNWSAVALSSSGSQMLAANANVGLYIFSGTTYVRAASGALDWTSVASSANGSNLIAAASGGDIYVSSNAGAGWNPVSNPGSGSWKAVASSSSGTILAAAAYGGGIWISYNSGSSWSQTTAPTEDWTSLACSSDGSKFVATAYNNGVYISDNWGATWLPQTSNLPTTTTWNCAASSSSGGTIAAGIYNPSASGNYGIYTSAAGSQTTTTAGTSGYISGGQGSAVELQYIGNNEFMPVGSTGTIWGY